MGGCVGVMGALGLVGLAENKANSAPIELELGGKKFDKRNVVRKKFGVQEILLKKIWVKESRSKNLRSKIIWIKRCSVQKAPKKLGPKSLVKIRSVTAVSVIYC